MTSIGKSVDDRFVGRKNERDAFRRLLKDPYGANRSFAFHGKGGKGKTWLIRALLADAAEARTQDGQQYFVPTLIDMSATKHRHIEGVMDAVEERLRTEKEALFIEYFSRYLQVKDRLAMLRERPDYSEEGLDAQLKIVQKTFSEGLRQFAEQQPLVLAFDTLEDVYGTSVYNNWLCDSAGLQVPGVICILAGRPAAGITPGSRELEQLHISEALNMYREYKGGDIELTDEEKRWTEVMHQKTGGNPLLLGLAISFNYAVGLSVEEVEGLNENQFREKVINFLQPSYTIAVTESIIPGISPELNAAFRQLLVCASYLNRRFNREILQRLIENDYVIVMDSNQFWERISLELPDLIFIKERSGDVFQLHDILAELIRFYILPTALEDESILTTVAAVSPPRLRQLTREDVPHWYDDFIEAAQDTYQKQLLRAEKLAYVLNTQVWKDVNRSETEASDEYIWAGTPEAERLAHALEPDFEVGLALLEAYYSEHSDVLDRFVLNEVPPEFVEAFPIGLRYRAAELLGIMARRIYALPQSAAYWEVAVATAEQAGDVAGQIGALIGQHNSTWQNDPRGSLALLRQAEQLTEIATHLRPDVYYEVGFTYREMQDVVEAIRWYERAQEEATREKAVDRLATILNDMGFAFSLAGNYGRARTLVETSREIREHRLDTLMRSGADENMLRDARLRVGMSFNTLGLIARHSGELTEANGDHTEALHHFFGVDDDYWVMQASHARGDVHRRIAKSLFDQTRTQAAEEYDQRAQEDIERSITLCEQNGYIQNSDSVYRHMGRLLHDRYFRRSDPNERLALLDEAQAYFEKALSSAEATEDMAEVFECLTEIAFLADDRISIIRQHFSEREEEELNRAQVYIHRLEEALEKHRQVEYPIHHLPVFENLLMIEKGALYYALGDFDQALGAYHLGFAGLASQPGYGEARYDAHKQHLFTNIRKLDDPATQRRWCEKLIETWLSTKTESGQKLADIHPDMIERCKLQMATSFIFFD